MYGMEPPDSYAAKVTVWPVVYDCADDGEMVGTASAGFTVTSLFIELVASVVVALSVTDMQ